MTTNTLTWQQLSMQPVDTAVNHQFILIIDFSWFLKSRIAVLAKTADLSYENESLNDMTDKQIAAKLTMDLCSDLRCMQYFVNDVVFAVDDARANLWRSKHQLLQPKDFNIDIVLDVEEAGYKGTRQYDKAINWLQVYRAAFKWLDAMKTVHGIRNIKLSGAEADDVIALFAKYATKAGRNIAWYGTDKDLTQICHTNQTTGAMAIYALIKNGCKANNWAKTRLIACDKLAYAKLNACKTSKVIQQSSIFDEMVGNVGNQTPANPYDAVCKYADTVYTEHTPSFLFYKIVLGDAGDNVPELFAHLKKSGSKNCHLSIGCIYDTLLKVCGIETDNDKELADGLRYMSYDDIYDPVIIDMFCDAAYKTFMKVDETPTAMKDWLHARFKENRKLVCLDSKSIPQDIQDNFEYVANFFDWQKCYANIDSLCDFQSTFQALGIEVHATAPQNQADTKFADTFVNGLFN